MTMRPTLKQRQVSTHAPATPDATPRQPNERDESPDSQASEPRDDIKQGYEDLKNGLVDTDLRGQTLVVNDATSPHHSMPDPSAPAEGRAPDPNTLKLPDGSEKK